MTNRRKIEEKETSTKLFVDDAKKTALKKEPKKRTEHEKRMRNEIAGLTVSSVQ